jgi:hypothetical protein
MGYYINDKPKPEQNEEQLDASALKIIEDAINCNNFSDIIFDKPLNRVTIEYIIQCGFNVYSSGKKTMIRLVK